MRQIIAVDPGPKQSAWITLDADRICDFGIHDNNELIGFLADFCIPKMAIEMVASYGMAVGKDIFETVYWIGRFCERFQGEHELIYRKDVKMHLCHSMRAKDANIRAAIIDLYPATGGGKTPQIGTKAAPGPLYGMKSHLWSALAVGLTYQEGR